MSAPCKRCDGEGRILIAHPNETLSPAAMEWGRHRVERSTDVPLNTIYDMECPACGASFRPPRLPYEPPDWLTQSKWWHP